MKSIFSAIAFVVSFVLGITGGFADDLTEAIATIQKVGPEGKGNAEAAGGWKTLTSQDSGAVIPILSAMKDSSPLARNWLRSAVEVLSEKQLAAKAELPTSEIQKFLLETGNDPYARKLAFDLIATIAPDTAKTLVPGMINDPSTALRRQAVALIIAEGKNKIGTGDKPGAVKALRKALDSSRDVDQIKEIASLLREKLEQKIDLPEHFGFLMYWHTIAPFDNVGRKGFAAVFPPEKQIDLKAFYPGKDGDDIAWKELSTPDEYGMLDFNKPYEPLKGVTGYAYTEFISSNARPAELRLGCKNGWKIWFNGEFLFGRDEYHRGARIDQYVLPVQLKEGKNTILIKACQDEQEQSWTVEWQFQLRICDSTGTAILSSDRNPTPIRKATRRRVKNKK